MEYCCIIVIDIITVRLYGVLHKTIGACKTLHYALYSCHSVVCICKLARVALMYHNVYEIVEHK